LFGEDLDINLVGVRKECREVETLVLNSAKTNNLPKKNFDGLETTSLFSHYNIFTYSGTALQSLYKKTKQSITPYLSDEGDYMIQAWLNMYYENQSIKWHRHYPAVAKAWHGFFCVSTEEQPSFTQYKVYPDIECKVNSKDGLLVFGKSDNDFHCSSVWTSKRPRITIAFDIIPIKYLYNNPYERAMINHFLPF
jgi:hypothetical protein